MKILYKFLICLVIPLSILYLIFNFDDTNKLDDFSFTRYLVKFNEFSTDESFNKLIDNLKADLLALRKSFKYNPNEQESYEDNISGIISIYEQPGMNQNVFDIPIVNDIISYIRTAENYFNSLVNSSSISDTYKTAINGLANTIVSFVPFTLTLFCVVYDYLGIAVYISTFAFDLILT